MQRAATGSCTSRMACCSWLRAKKLIALTPLDGAPGVLWSSGVHRALLLFSSITPNSRCDPHDSNDRNHPRCEKRDCHTDHAQAPHDRTSALCQCPSHCGEETALARNDVALTVNLNRDVSRSVRFIDLCARAVLALHSQVLDFAERVERFHERQVIFHRHAQPNVCQFASVGIAIKCRIANASTLFFGERSKL